MNHHIPLAEILKWLLDSCFPGHGRVQLLQRLQRGGLFLDTRLEGAAAELHRHHPHLGLKGP